MKAIVLLALMGSIATADTSRGSVGAPQCKPAGGLLFEIDQRGEPADKNFTATAKLYANGSWSTGVYETSGKLARTVSGCLSSVQVDTIRDTLEAAKWKVSHRDVSCGAPSARSTVYKWKGRIVYTDRACNADALDAESTQALDWLACLLGVPEGFDDGFDEGLDEEPLLPMLRTTRTCRGIIESR